ncbi:MAG: hypothetical protein JNK57_16780 [Planctomycetaceae bacterium]|nr:hypothetical protein [Planctomycetaceae bacterium]
MSTAERIPAAAEAVGSLAIDLFGLVAYAQNGVWLVGCPPDQALLLRLTVGSSSALG